MQRTISSAEFSAHDIFINKGPTNETALRRLFDLTFCLSIFPFVVPFVLLVGLALKLSEPSQPVFYGASRVGLHGKTFRMWKFRTMRNDIWLVRCEEVIRQFEPQRNFKLERDPRVSWLGRVMRKSHIDELPQFFNVFKGDMTLVGPRPNSRPVSAYEPWQLERLTVRPGLTGPWQIFGDRDVDYAERFSEDIDYIRTRTVLSDFKIILRTIFHCAGMKGIG